jgi:beta-xylosidase
MAQNPISPAGVYIADPSARVMPDGKLYIYGSRDESRDYYCSKQYNILSSSDLKHWDLTKGTFATAGTNDQVSYSDDILYAPDCVEKDGTYYLYYCLANGGEGVATSSSPKGPFINGTPLDVKGIDPVVFIDDDGQAYYYWGQFSAKGAKLNKDMKTIDASSIKDGLVTEKEHHFHEGSWVFKRNGLYYFVYTSLSDKKEATTIGYSISKSPLGPFKYMGTIIDNTGCDPCSWNNHGSVTEYKGEWYVFYHRSTHACQTLRKACVEKIHFNADGSIPQVEMTSQGAGNPLDAFSTTDAARACLLTGKMRIVQSGPEREELARIEHYNLATYKYLKFSHSPKKIIVRVASQAGGKIQVLTDSYSTRGTIDIPAGDGKTYREYSADIKDIPEGIFQVRFRFLGSEDKDLMRFDSFRFE